MIKNKERESNFELLRIICMIMIVTLHALGHGGALGNTKIGGRNFILINMLESISIVAVNCYILIAGFFGVNTKFRVKKAFKLYVQVLFYSLVISILFWSFGVEKVTESGILNMLFPIARQTWWFMSVFLVLYFLTPYINKLIKGLSFKEYTKLLILLMVIFVIWPSIFYFSPIDNGDGYSLYSFIVLYIVGGYIKLFFNNIKFNKKITLGGYIVIALLLGIYNIKISKEAWSFVGVYNYNFIPIFIASILLFLFFKEIKIQSRVINKIASLTLGVYLIDDHPYMRAHIYKFFKYSSCFNTHRFILYTMMMVIVIYISASFIEFLRQMIFKLIKL